MPSTTTEVYAKATYTDIEEAYEGLSRATGAGAVTIVADQGGVRVVFPAFVHQMTLEEPSPAALKRGRSLSVTFEDVHNPPGLGWPGQFFVSAFEDELESVTVHDEPWGDAVTLRAGGGEVTFWPREV